MRQALAWQAAVNVVAFWRSIFYCGASGGTSLCQRELVPGQPWRRCAAASACATAASARFRQPFDGAARVRAAPFELKPRSLGIGTRRVSEEGGRASRLAAVAGRVGPGSGTRGTLRRN